MNALRTLNLNFSIKSRFKQKWLKAQIKMMLVTRVGDLLNFRVLAWGALSHPLTISRRLTSVKFWATFFKLCSTANEDDRVNFGRNRKNVDILCASSIIFSGKDITQIKDKLEKYYVHFNVKRVVTYFRCGCTSTNVLNVYLSSLHPK